MANELLQGAMQGLAVGLRGYTAAKIAVAQAKTEQERQQAVMALEQRRVNLQELVVRSQERQTGAQLASQERIETQRGERLERIEVENRQLRKDLGELQAKIQREGIQSGEQIATGAQGVQREGIQSGERIATGAQGVQREGIQSGERIATGAQGVQREGFQVQERIAKEANETQLAITEGKNATDLRIAQLKDETDRLNSLMMTTQGKPEDAAKLRDEYIKGAKRYVEVLDQAARFNALDAVANPAGIKDDAMIRLYHKMLDPNSVVREGEFGQILVVDSFTNRIITQYNKAADGTLLGGKGSRLRSDLADTIQRLIAPFYDLKRQHEETYQRLAGINAATVVIPLTVQDVGGGGEAPSGGMAGVISDKQRTAIIVRLWGMALAPGADISKIRNDARNELKGYRVSDREILAIFKDAPF